MKKLPIKNLYNTLGLPWNPSTFELDKNMTWNSQKIGANYIGNDTFLIINDGIITVLKGFIWNGASGVPDTSETYQATCIHDVLYLNLDMNGFPFNRKECDQIFYDILKYNNFKFARLYYVGVRLLGGLFHSISK